MNKPWSDYLRWKEGGKCFLLYMSDNLFQIVPKRFFHSDSDIDTFREMLTMRIGRVARLEDSQEFARRGGHGPG